MVVAIGKVLIVDDSLFMRTRLKEILCETHYEVVGEACNGQEAIEAYQQLRPDVVTMDIVMPEVNGIDAVRGIVEVDPTAKIVMLSSLNQKAMVKKALEYGARDFIPKPFKREKSIEVLDRVLGE